MPAWRWRIQATGLGLGFAVLALVACATPEPPSALEDREWYLVSIGTTTLDVATEKRPTLRLESEGSRAAGFAGCNRFAGHYTLAGQDLKFGPLAATKMSCDQAKTEDRYLAALGRVAHWSLESDALTLSPDEKGPVLRFRELTPTRRAK